MDKIKVLIAVSLILSTGLATVKVLDPVQKTLEKGEVLDLRGNPYQSGYNIELDIKKNGWTNATSKDLSTEFTSFGDNATVSLIGTPSETGNYTAQVTFEAADGSTQTNEIQYRIEETPLHMYMKYPIKGELPEGKLTEIGSVAPGQWMTLILGRRLDSGPFRWGEAKSPGHESRYYNIPQEKELKDVLPPETIAKKGLGNETYISLTLQAPRQTGEFKFNVMMDSEFSSSATRRLSVNVERDVYDFQVPETVDIQAGEPSQIPIQIKSNSIAVENFTFTPKTLPEAWITGEKGRKKTEVKVRAGETVNFTLPIQINQEGVYKAVYSVKDSRGTDVGDYSIRIRAKPTLGSKLQGFKKGHSITLPLLQPFYSLLSFFG